MVGLYDLLVTFGNLKAVILFLSLSATKKRQRMARRDSGGILFMESPIEIPV